MNKRINLDETKLYVRELTEGEKNRIESAIALSAMSMCPDVGILSSGEEVEVSHAFYSADGLNYGITYSDRKYSTVNEAEVTLSNPKFDWKYIADQNEKR